MAFWLSLPSHLTELLAYAAAIMLIRQRAECEYHEYSMRSARLAALHELPVT